MMESSTPSTKLLCANNPNAVVPCRSIGTLACKNCLLVPYCSKDCQAAHWPIHRKDCRSMNSWQPSWVKEGRIPTFLSSIPKHVPYGPNKYPWGNVPAFDVIQLKHNEGVDFQNPLNLLFPASGDMRNVILSIANLHSYNGPLGIVLNDKEMDIVARNAIFLLTFFVEDNPIIAAEYVLHLWYSALITGPCQSFLRDRIRPMIKNICDKIIDKPGSLLLAKTWSFGNNSSLRLVLSRDKWFSFLSYFDVPQGLTEDTAQRVRRAVMLAPERVDYVDRVMCLKTPAGRLCMSKFRVDGILLPFSQTREEFRVPNPTLFHSTYSWEMMDNSDPTSGWSLKSFLEVNIGPTKNDTYGKLYHYLRKLFVEFHHRLRAFPIKFDLFQGDARSLQLDAKKFDRIDVGNITDMYYLGIGETLEKFGPLLQPTTINRHATLITLFLNAIREINMMKKAGKFPQDNKEDHREKVFQYMPELTSQLTTIGMVKTMMAMNIVQDMDGNFDRYTMLHAFDSAALSSGLRMKDPHTIIERWPMRVSQELTEQAKEYFALLLSSSHNGQERYVEWSRTAG
ncbi:hypothetical protein F5Y00DRAFT_269392 [Daldinia vernicosa]|uniref:uncharacterized protein n=1 Tax=Daldinia vernicosa TaxID=114800 RepID=UPI002008C899|nr:uncharacterized protein F5Y00DRAFT_269392 [Daldinia vernicosa]KAI0849407.1 hypothetical protein F5Y00DRAFT_269392 [Daldinia vernicosa]